MGKPDLAWSSLALAIGIAACAVLLCVHLWWERGRRRAACRPSSDDISGCRTCAGRSGSA